MLFNGGCAPRTSKKGGPEPLLECLPLKRSPCQCVSDQKCCSDDATATTHLPFVADIACSENAADLISLDKSSVVSVALCRPACND